MCGIFSVIAKSSEVSINLSQTFLTDIAKLSEVRGVDSSGFCYIEEDKKNYKVTKGPLKISSLFNKTKLNRRVQPTSSGIFFAFGHTRLVTNGSQLSDDNNQPVVKAGTVGVHNGIIVNDRQIWENHPTLPRNYEIDTEVIISLLRDKIANNIPLKKALLEIEKEAYGTISIAFLFEDSSDFLVYSNYGSFYVLTDDDTFFILASEKNILNELVKKHSFLKNHANYRIEQILPLTGYLVNVEDFKIKHFNLKDSEEINLEQRNEKYAISVENVHSNKDQIPAVVDPEKFRFNPSFQSERNLLQYNIDQISRLKRCTKCILPETFPFIKFDEQGICNYCNNYKIKNCRKPIEKLLSQIEPFRKNNGVPDVLIPFSGGRDSTFSLHVVKKELELNPIAFTYDWGMVTDLARRNIARACGKLGVEHIIVSADIKLKRNNIRKNILAWLRKPQLGLVPLFMAGDKYFIYYANRVAQQNGLDLIIWGTNQLENTDFKLGFSGIEPNFEKEELDYVDFVDKLKLLSYFATSYILNPYYLNSSVIDTFGAFLSRYAASRKNYFHLFDYFEWDEETIESLLKDDYRWEFAIDSPTSWRIGDGTASFYNYIYFTVCGFTEFDTFRSNQIREGMISRDDAMKFILKENLPRYETIKWYLEILGLPFNRVIKVINNMPKLYESFV